MDTTALTDSAFAALNAGSTAPDWLLLLEFLVGVALVIVGVVRIARRGAPRPPAPVGVNHAQGAAYKLTPYARGSFCAVADGWAPEGADPLLGLWVAQDDGVTAFRPAALVAKAAREAYTLDGFVRTLTQSDTGTLTPDEWAFWGKVYYRARVLGIGGR